MHASALSIAVAALLGSVAAKPAAPAASRVKPAAAPAAHAAPAAAPAEAAPVAPEPRDWNAPPPGSTPEDAALWSRVRSAIEDATLAVSRLNKCSFRLRAGTYYESLDALAREKADGARALRQRLEAAARATEAVLPRPLRTHVCKYTLLHLEQRMDALGDPKLSAEMPRYRRESTACADDLGGLATRLAARLTELEGVLADADVALGRAAPAAGEAAPGGEPGSLLPAGGETR